MLGTGTILSSALRYAPVAQVSDTQVDVFSNLYLVFIGLGTLVGIIVMSYTVYNAYKYRTTDKDVQGRYDVDENELDGESDEYSVARPQSGEIPTGQGKGGGKKLFMSFGMSAVLVLGLIIYSYSLLLYVEDTSANEEDALEVEVEGYQFGWDFEYESGLTSSDYDASELSDVVGEEVGSGALVVPEGEVTQLRITSRDTFHNFGIPEFRAKGDAIPNDYTNTWFQPEKTGLFRANCYELCGQGHSDMHGDVVVLPEDEFEEWYLSQDGVSEEDVAFLEGEAS